MIITGTPSAYNFTHSLCAHKFIGDCATGKINTKEHRACASISASEKGGKMLSTSLTVFFLRKNAAVNLTNVSLSMRGIGEMQQCDLRDEFRTQRHEGEITHTLAISRERDFELILSILTRH
jgi:succinate dehydrogenase/fumarate reductase-like Fe-S protein